MLSSCQKVEVYPRLIPGILEYSIRCLLDKPVKVFGMMHLWIEHSFSSDQYLASLESL